MTRTRNGTTGPSAPKLSIVVAVVVVLTMAATTAIAAPGRPGEPRYLPGADGVGDDYFPQAGNGGYEVDHYHLELRYEPLGQGLPANQATGMLEGIATIDLTATVDLDRFNLDLRGLEVEQVVVDGKPMRFSHEGQELMITPRPKLKAGQQRQVEVRYGGTTGRPTDLGGDLYGWVSTPDGAMVVSEPDGAPTWYPVNDHPTDKATYSFAITVPEGTVAVANGLLVDEVTAQGWTTFVWDAPDLMASYLATATIGNFELTSYVTDSGLPIINAIDADLPAEAAAGIARTDQMLSFFESIYGPYPFVSYGAIIDDDTVGYALETQTRPVYSRVAREGTVAHELAHQWLGNSVSPARWQDIWLNEGWAVYSEWLWNEHVGIRSVQAAFDQQYARAAGSAFWQTIVADPGADNLFATAVYQRGAMTLHLLRQRVGDETFFELARDWITTYEDSAATTEDFIALASSHAGEDLDGFFEVWLYTPGKPPLP
jgi:aminopeptidase N